MLLKDLFTNWPPAITIEAGNIVDNADLGDVVMSVKKEGTALRNRHGVSGTVYNASGS